MTSAFFVAGDLAVVGVLVGGLDLVDGALVGAAGGVEEGLARGGDVLVARGEVGRPVALEHLGDLGAVGGEPCGGEQVGAVADALGADVGAVADELAVGAGGGLDLVVEPAALQVIGHGGEQVGVLHDLGQPVDLDGLDVGEAGLAELLEVVLAGFVAGRGLVVHDLHVRVRVHVLLQERVGVAEVVEGGDGEGHLAVDSGAATGAGAAGEHEGGGGRDGGDERGPAQGTSIHRSLLCGGCDRNDELSPSCCGSALNGRVESMGSLPNGQGSAPTFTSSAHPRSLSTSAAGAHPPVDWASQRHPTSGAEVPTIVVDVMPKAELLDPQGKAVAGALSRLGETRFSDVRIGKRFELTVEGEVDEATLARARELADEMLSNAVIEDVVNVEVVE
ncbi:phosphoribosylformylglycinamidine synthase PurS subunit [Microbacterium testaceum]|nr:phosphoribosylformylglycinamidine synthase PurS subunit [Microbacterium testaceum]